MTVAFLYHKNDCKFVIFGRITVYDMIIYTFILHLRQGAPYFYYYTKYIKWIPYFRHHFEVKILPLFNKYDYPESSFKV